MTARLRLPKVMRLALGTLALLGLCTGQPQGLTAMAASAPQPGLAVSPDDWTSDGGSPLAALAPDPSLPTVDVHVWVLSDHPGVAAIASPAACRREVDILNRYFRTAEGGKLVNFRWKETTSYDRALELATAAVLAANAEGRPETGKWAPLVRAHRALQDRRAANLYVVDTWSKQHGWSDNDSLGGQTDLRPMVWIDYKRLGHRVQSPEEHEMGHGFGLPHVCEPGTKGNTATNIMASYSDCPGSSGGKRNLGFNAHQTEIIRTRLKAFLQRVR